MNYLFPTDYTALYQFALEEPKNDKKLLRFCKGQFECVLLSETKWHERIFAWLGFGPLHLRDIAIYISDQITHNPDHLCDTDRSILKKLASRCHHYNKQTCGRKISEPTLKKFNNLATFMINNDENKIELPLIDEVPTPFTPIPRPNASIDRPGLYLEINCVQANCIDANKKAWVYKGLGSVDLSKACCTTNCPTCTTRVHPNNVENIGLYECFYNLEGMTQEIENPPTERQRYDIHNAQTSKRYFSRLYIDSWIYLNIETKAKVSQEITSS